ncbi:MAG: NAD(P)/FAD-dependent oxidoreductase [Thermodesulfobacteriota bacterium]|nr:NAD(P)/FAD-dependent oxidoreductase [Thermodesulfobacteriota bacterium]
MADASFDIVVVGGGNKALIASMYLTKYGGLKVGIFEEKHELGTGWCTEESPAPGFLANHCSHIHPDFETYHKPVYEDFPEWIDYGVKYVPHRLNMGVAFIEDDSWIGTYSRIIDPSQEKTAEIISRFSKKDAETWLWLWDKIQKYIQPAMEEWLFTPARPLGIPDAIDRLIMNPEAEISPEWIFMSPAQVFRDLFESKEAQCMLGRGIQGAGFAPDTHGSGAGVLIWLAAWMASGTLAGGVHTLAHASQRVILQNGGKVFTKGKVDKIIIENGKARGICLGDGTEVEAKMAVLSTADPYQLFVELTGEEYFSPRLVRKIKNLERDYTTINWYTWALHERPVYRAESFDEDLPYVSCLHLGTKGLNDLLEENYTRRMGRWPDPKKMQLAVCNHSIIEPSYAPEGKACVLTEEFVLPATAMTEKEWKKMEKQHAKDVIANWKRFAPNMTWDNVIGYIPVTPFFISRHARNWGTTGNWNVIDAIPSQTGRMRPVPELASGRMPVKNLYATGAGWHPFGGGHSAQGYNIYKIMAEDFRLQKPWEEKGRPY